MKRSHLLVFALVFSATILGLSYDVVELVRPGEPTKLYSEAFEMSGQIWINGDDLWSGEKIVYAAPLTVTIIDPNGEVYRVDDIRTKTEKEKNSLVCSIACGASFEHKLVDVDAVIPGEWKAIVRYNGDETYRAAQNVLKFKVG